MRRKIKQYISPYINCSMNGAISLFMAVLMTPFLTIAMVLVDTGRYNSAVSILDEAMGVSSTSTLAEMDSYLHKRWGVLGVDQEHSVEDTYTKYLTTNAEILGESLQLDEITAEGMYSLAENEVLYNQILEYCKLNAPTELALNFGNISEILSLFDNLKMIDSVMDICTAGIGTLDASIALVKSADELKEIAAEMEKKIQDYHDDYEEFESAVSSLVDALNEPEPEKSDYTDGDGNLDSAAYEKAKEEWKKAIEDARSSANSARDTYAETIGELQDSMTLYKEKMAVCNGALQDIGTKAAETAVSIADYQKKSSETEDNLKALQKDIDKWEKGSEFDPTEDTYLNMKDWEQALSRELAENDTQYQMLKAQKAGLDAVQNGYKEHFEKYNDAVFGECIQSLFGLKTIVETFEADAYTKESSGISADTYHNVTISVYVSAEDVDAYMEAQKEELMGGSLKDLLDGLITFYNSIFKTSLFYEPEFSAVIDMDYYDQYLGGLEGNDSYEGSALAVVQGIGVTIAKVEEFRMHFMTLRLVTAFEDFKQLLQSVARLFDDIVKFVTNIMRNLEELLSSYDKMYYSTYAAFNLPCRTDKKASGLSFSGMTGYSLKKDSLPDQGITSNPTIFDDLEAAITALSAYSNGTGDDLTFSGAELEYILYGSECEIANQMYTFFSLYLIRLLLDIGPITTNAEVQSLAAASTLAYPIVMFLVILAEPLADTVVLANGGEIGLIKTNVFLTPSGLPDLLGKIVTIARFDQESKDKIKDAVVGAYSATGEDYDYQKLLKDNELAANSSNPKPGQSKYVKKLLNFNYREYCFFMLLLTVSKEQQFTRLKNLIQMETLYHYKAVEKKSYVFDLRKSYTYLDMKATVQVKQMMPSLIDTSLFTATRQQYRGY